METSNHINFSLEELRDQQRRIKSKGRYYTESQITEIPPAYANEIKQSRINKNQKIKIEINSYDDAKKEVWMNFINIALQGDKNKFIPSEKFNKNSPELIKYFIGDKTIFDSKKGILLIGPCGTGKTKAMASISKMLLDSENKNSFSTKYCPDLCDVEMIKDGWIARDKCFHKSIFFDDLGAESNRVYKKFGNKANVMGSILSERYRRFNNYGQKTHLSTNLSEVQMKKFYSVRVYDRMIEMFNFISLGEKSLRR